MDLNYILDRLATSFDTYLSGIIDALPSVIVGIIVLLIGWTFAKLIRMILKRTVNGKLDDLAQKSGIASVLRKVGIHSFGKFIGMLIYGGIMLVFLMAAADIMGMTRVQDGVSSFFAYLPTLITAITIFMAGLWVGEQVSTVITNLTETMGISGGRSMGKVLGGIMVLFISITALNVAGVDTELITSNLQIILAGVLFAFGLAYAYASRNILTNILSSFYGKDRFKPGMRIKVGEDEGIIDRIDSMTVTIQTVKGEVLIPTSRLITERIEILETPNIE
ncbi:MAG: mechanosensitive ion channel [Flavobacteriales bacterium]|nr:mechanosensitive ion channel [Flavobacteriales bacterium]